MAKVIQTQQKVIVEPWWGKLTIVYIGMAMGLLWWVATVILRHYVVDPLACRDLGTAAACVDSFGVAGSIAAIIIAILGAAVLIRNLQPRPIVIAIAAAVLLWDLGSLLNGVTWWEAGLWALFFYAATYSLFSLVARLSSTIGAVAVAAAVVIVIRLILII